MKLSKLLAMGSLCGVITSMQATQLPTFCSDPSTAKPAYAPGQVWTYKTRPNDQQSTLTILKVERYPRLGRVVHISINGVNVKNAAAPGGFSHKIGHIPMAESSLLGSTLKLVRSKDNIETDEMQGYVQWRKAFDAGKAGIYTITAAGAVQSVEDVLAKGKEH